MRISLRLFITLVCVLAVYFFVYWMGGAILIVVGLPESIIGLVSFASACFIAWFVWTRTSKPYPGLARAIFLGAIITGGIGFCAGFFGPIIFTPDANQGPLLGLFITGPLGFVIGAAGGAVYWVTRGRRTDNAAKHEAG